MIANAAPRFKNLASEIARVQRITGCGICARAILANGRETYRERVITITKVLDQHDRSAHR